MTFSGHVRSCIRPGDLDSRHAGIHGIVEGLIHHRVLVVWLPERDGEVPTDQNPGNNQKAFNLHCSRASIVGTVGSAEPVQGNDRP